MNTLSKMQENYDITGIRTIKRRPVEPMKNNIGTARGTSIVSTIEHQASLIKQLTESNRQLSEVLDPLQRNLNFISTPTLKERYLIRKEREHSEEVAHKAIREMRESLTKSTQDAEWQALSDYLTKKLRVMGLIK